MHTNTPIIITAIDLTLELIFFSIYSLSALAKYLFNTINKHIFDSNYSTISRRNHEKINNNNNHHHCTASLVQITIVLLYSNVANLNAGHGTILTMYHFNALTVEPLNIVILFKVCKFHTAISKETV